MREILVNAPPAERAADLATLERALAYFDRPDGWRSAEYGMTKAAAAEAIGILMTRPDAEWTLPLFDWQVLRGELARLALGRKDKAAAALFCHIGVLILQDETAAAAVSLVRLAEAAGRRRADMESSLRVAQDKLHAARHAERKALGAARRGPDQGRLDAAEGHAAPPA